MSFIKRIPSLCLVLFLFTGCSDKNMVGGDGNPESVDSLETASNNIEIRYSNAGGMSPESEYIFISNDSASWKYGRHNKEAFITWIPSASDITSIVQVLEKNNYTKIESRQEKEVYDRGGVQIVINRGEIETNLNNSGRTFIKDEWSDNFRTIRSYIQTYVQAEIEKQLLTLKFKADASVYESKEPIKLWLNEELFYDSDEQQSQSIASISVYPGNNIINWTICYADSVGYNGKPIYKNGGESIFDVPQDSEEVVIEKKEQEILIFAR